MAELIIANKAELVEIADAVRSKTGKIDAMSLVEIASDINSISVGGSADIETTTVDVYDLGYIYYVCATVYKDGQLTYEQYDYNQNDYYIENVVIGSVVTVCSSNDEARVLTNATHLYYDYSSTMTFQITGQNAVIGLYSSSDDVFGDGII